MHVESGEWQCCMVAYNTFSVCSPFMYIASYACNDIFLILCSHTHTYLLFLIVKLMIRRTVAKSNAVSNRKLVKHKAATEIEDRETSTPSEGGLLSGWPVASKYRKRY